MGNGFDRKCFRCRKFAARGFEHCANHAPLVESGRDVDYLDRPGFIYLLRSGGSRHYKIGWTMLTIEERVADIQVGNPQRIRIIEVIAGTQRQEQALHVSLVARRRRGEWFVFDSREEAIAALLTAKAGG